ncbi:MAG: SpoIID/LytB domain-containing protein [Geobacteraceae bacterium]
MRIAIIILLLLVALPAKGGESVQFHREVVRVALMKGAESVRLDGYGMLATDETGEPLRLDKPLVVKRGRDGLLVNGRPVKSLKVAAPAAVLVNGKGYRGSVEITSSGQGLLIVNELPLEDYLVGLINCEISSQWPMEAIKAQAVIARSYALFQKEARSNAPYHLESSVTDQVYEGCDIEDSCAARGVMETDGEVLTYKGRVIQAFYHSNCGGHTEASKNVWGMPLPYLQGVDCKYCLAAPSSRWEQSIPLRKLESLLKASGYQVTGLKEIREGERNRSGRLNGLELTAADGKMTVPAVAFRKAIGYTVIKSTNFEVRTVGDDAFLSGAGYGHGVGLCQWGAKKRAGDGFNYREILSYYYPGVRVEKLSGD